MKELKKLTMYFMLVMMLAFVGCAEEDDDDETTASAGGSSIDNPACIVENEGSSVCIDYRDADYSQAVVDQACETNNGETDTECPETLNGTDSYGECEVTSGGTTTHQRTYLSIWSSESDAETYCEDISGGTFTADS